MEAVSYVEDYESDSDSNESDFCEPKRKKPKTYCAWMKTKEFQSSAEAEEAVSAKEMWKKCSSTKTSSGLRVQYRCSAGQYRVKECPAGLYLLYHSMDSGVSMYRNECEHENHVSDPSRGLSIDMKRFIKEKFHEGIQKPNAILAVIRQKKLPEPPKGRIVTYLKTLREGKCGSPTVSAREIHDWCEARAQKPDDVDKPFVLSHHVHAESHNVDEQDLKIVISTLRLLDFMKKSEMVQIDATYKLNWQGYPVMVVGTSDKNNVFHPFAIAVCKSETTDDFGFIFTALHDLDVEWKPTVLLADGSDAITAGFQLVFGEPLIRLMCFFHVLKNIEKYLKVLTKGKRHGDLKDDIHALQLCQSDLAFEKASQLFMKKWTSTKDAKVTEFAVYFEEQWLKKYSKWYEGAAVGFPSTNNGLESTNAVIKREHTLRERLPVGQFLNSVEDLLTKWSEARNAESVNGLSFAERPTASLKEWTSAYQWASMNKRVLKQSAEDSKILFFTTSSNTTESITQEILTTFKAVDCTWDTFDNFKQSHFSIWTITINEKDISDFHCTCPYYLKKSICKHTLGMQIRLKLVSAPPEAKTIPLGQKRKRGRPAKAKQALLLN